MYEQPPRRKVLSYVCPGCAHRVEFLPCLICEAREAAPRAKTYRGRDDDGSSFGLSPDEELRRQEVLGWARTQRLRPRAPIIEEEDYD